MFSLIQGFFTYLFAKKEAQVLILGLDNAGKTTTLEQIKAIYKKTNPMPFDKIPPTIGLNIGRIELNNVKAIFWDLGGQNSFRVIWDKYYSEAHGLIYIVDSSDSERLDEAVSVFKDMIRHTDLLSIPILIMANKQDLKGALGIEKLESVFDVKMLQGHAHVVFSSACIHTRRNHRRYGLFDGAGQDCRPVTTFLDLHTALVNAFECSTKSSTDVYIKRLWKWQTVMNRCKLLFNIYQI